MKKTRITICGNYGATNLGDEALLEGILHMVRRSFSTPDITVLSANPDETTATHGVRSAKLIPAGIRSWIDGLKTGSSRTTKQILKDSDLFILGGGGLFTDEKIHAVFIWALQAWMARRNGTPLFCLGQSVGPLESRIGRWVTRKVFQWADAVTVRDEDSKFLLERLGIDGVQVLADPAFALDSTLLQEKRENYVVLSVRPWIHGDPQIVYKRLADFVDWLWSEHRLKTILVPFQVSHDNDVQELERISGLVSEADAVELFDYSADFQQVLELMSRARAVVGMRLHSLIASSLAHTPFIGLSYSPKVQRFCRQMEMSDFVLDWPNFSLDDLRKYFDQLLKEWDELSERIDQGVLKLRNKTLGHEDVLRSFQEHGLFLVLLYISFAHGGL
ncbi:MAG: polysaccharide pyruvyl transferase family protein [Candidatus Gracilibacteria bacterium]